MKYLICAGKYCKAQNANTNIALKIAEALRRKGHTCYIVFNDDSIGKRIDSNYNGFETYRIPTSHLYSFAYNHYTSKKKNSFSKLKYALKYPLHALVYLILKNDDLFSYSMFIDFVFQFYNKNKIDYVLAIVKPFYPLLALIKKYPELKVIYYQLDPWGLHELDGKQKNNSRIADEILVMEHCCHIFTTYALYSQYRSDKRYNALLEKISPVHFPKISKYCKEENTNTSSALDNYFDIYYLGTIYDEYRDPGKVIDFIMSSKLRTRLFLMGEIHSESCKAAITKYPDRIILSEQVSSEKASEIMNSHVFLLNINNNISNQSPSKLIDYISTGNPIINCIKLIDDQSEETLSQYDMAFHFYEYDENKNDINSLDDFLESNKHKKMDYNKIMKRYYAYTPEYIAESILQHAK